MNVEKLGKERVGRERLAVGREKVCVRCVWLRSVLVSVLVSVLEPASVEVPVISRTELGRGLVLRTELGP